MIDPTMGLDVEFIILLLIVLPASFIFFLIAFFLSIRLAYEMFFGVKTYD